MDESVCLSKRIADLLQAPHSAIVDSRNVLVVSNEKNLANTEKISLCTSTDSFLKDVD